jgi:hypothetical protein
MLELRAQLPRCVIDKESFAPRTRMYVRRSIGSGAGARAVVEEQRPVTCFGALLPPYGQRVSSMDMN